MAEMRRVIATCHRHKIKVVPYFSMSELHPESEGYERHVGEWKRSIDGAGTVLHDLVGKGEYGAQMCLESGWLERRQRDVERAFRELEADGIYYDIAWTVPCNNPAHASGPHHSIDSVLALLAWTRRLIGEQGVLVVHSGGPVASIAIENYADLLVTMEHLSKTERLLSMDDIPITAWLGETAPRAPCPSYRADRSLERNQRNIAHFVVLGMFPFWRATGPSTAPVAGPGYDLSLNLYRAFLPYRLEQYRFQHALSGAVATNRDGVYGALYSGSSAPALVVIANTNPQAQRDLVWRVMSEKLGIAGRQSLSVKDVSSGSTRTIAVRALAEGMPVAEIDGYAFRLFELNPLP